ncbi:MAG: hypothetical protein ACXWLH_00480 [Candidatus Saccharimonadales bacterium]
MVEGIKARGERRKEKGERRTGRGGEDVEIGGLLIYFWNYLAYGVGQFPFPPLNIILRGLL